MVSRFSHKYCGFCWTKYLGDNPSKKAVKIVASNCVKATKGKEVIAIQINNAITTIKPIATSHPRIVKNI